MNKVTPLFVTALEAHRAGELFVRSHRPRDRTDEEKKRYRAAMDELMAELAKFGHTRMVQCDARQRRSMYIWLVNNTKAEECSTQNADSTPN